MAKRIRPSRAKGAKAAGSNVGNPAPGVGEQGMNAQERAAVDEAETIPKGLNAEQVDMEKKRIERGSQIRGTGDKPAPVHGASHFVENSTTSVERIHSVDPLIEQQLKPKTVKVRAIKLGYYDDKRRRTGDVFLIRTPYQVKNTDRIADKDGKVPDTITIDEFSDKWMERVDASTPEKTTTGKEALKQQHDAELAARRPTKVTETAPAATTSTSDKDVIGAGS